MTAVERLRYGGLLAASAVLAAFEVFYLPLRFDGRLLPDLGGMPFPVTILLAAVSLQWLVLRAGALVPGAKAAAGPLLVWLGVLLLMLVVVPGGDRIILADWRTLVLLAAGAFPAMYRIGDVMGRAATSARGGETGTSRA